MSVVNPRDLLLKQLAELLWIELTLFFEVLPKVHDDAHAEALQTLLTEHRLASGRAEGFVFGDGVRPPRPDKLTERADAASKAAGLERITLHEARHTYASLMIAAGVNAKALSTYMGHANISITLDR